MTIQTGFSRCASGIVISMTSLTKFHLIVHSLEDSAMSGRFDFVGMGIENMTLVTVPAQGIGIRKAFVAVVTGIQIEISRKNGGSMF